MMRRSFRQFRRGPSNRATTCPQWLSPSAMLRRRRRILPWQPPPRTRVCCRMAALFLAARAATARSWLIRSWDKPVPQTSLLLSPTLIPVPQAPLFYSRCARPNRHGLQSAAPAPKSNCSGPPMPAPTPCRGGTSSTPAIGATSPPPQPLAAQISSSANLLLARTSSSVCGTNLGCILPHPFDLDAGEIVGAEFEQRGILIKLDVVSRRAHPRGAALPIKFLQGQNVQCERVFAEAQFV